MHVAGSRSRLSHDRGGSKSIHFWIDFLHFVPLLGRFFSSALSVYIGNKTTLIIWSQKVAQFCEPFSGS